MVPRKRRLSEVLQAKTDQTTSLKQSRVNPARPDRDLSLSLATDHDARGGAGQVTTFNLHDETKLCMQGADVHYVPDFVEASRASGWMQQLEKLDTWYNPTLKLYGREIKQSRKIAAYASEPRLDVKYSGQRVVMHYDYPPILREIQDFVEEKLDTAFNHCMLNFYEDGSVYIGNHRDTKENSVIGSLSLGASRTFIMRHDSIAKLSSSSKKPHANSPLYQRWVLKHGSLVVMQGDTQKNWKHEIPKCVPSPPPDWQGSTSADTVTNSLPENPKLKKDELV